MFLIFLLTCLFFQEKKLNIYTYIDTHIFYLAFLVVFSRRVGRLSPPARKFLFYKEEEFKLSRFLTSSLIQQICVSPDHVTGLGIQQEQNNGAYVRWYETDIQAHEIYAI